MIRIFVMTLVALAFVPLGQAQAQINQAMCSYLPSNSGAHLAGANYVPGVDVRGNAVVPADVNAQVPGSVDVIRFPVTVDMAQQLTQTLTQGTEMQAPVMMVEIHTGGGVMIDGVDVTNNAYRLCGKVPPAITEAKMPEPVPPENTEPAAGQKEEIIWGEGY
ncbi:MAG: hypothetical protein H6867_08555 [Rhodospirillales bacterium]|nr:hypothetical protein [Rhodospirillales bacterium]MCB9995604.1 hypothetical protein [Rhodospirillales bacterium]